MTKLAKLEKECAELKKELVFANKNCQTLKAQLDVAEKALFKSTLNFNESLKIMEKFCNNFTLCENCKFFDKAENLCSIHQQKRELTDFCNKGDRERM